MTRTTAPETLYGARSHDSALFSVAAIARAGDTTPTAPRGDSSGFIDVKSVAASTPSDETPSMLRMQTTPHVTGRPRRGGLYVAAASLAMALVSSLTALAAPAPAPADGAPALSDDVVSDYSFELEDAASSILDEPFDDDVFTLAVDDDEDDELPPPEAVEPEVEAEPEPVKKRATRSKRTTAKRASTKAKAPAEAKAPAKAAAPEPKASGPDPMSVDCLLNPASCKTKSAAKPAPEPAKRPSVSLPEKLTASALKAGIAATKDRAERVCADLASSGDKAQVKLSIRGSTGEVMSSAAYGGDPELGACVARELKASTFDRFSAPQQGLLVTVRF